MLPFLTAHGVSIALDIGKKQAQKYIQKKIDYAILEEVQKKVETEMNSFIYIIKKRSEIYILIAAINIIALIISHNFSNLIFLKFLALIISITFLAYMLHNSVRGFTKYINYFQNFEKHIKSLLSLEIRNAKEENWKNKLMLLVNSKEVHDYYLFVLDKIVFTSSTWLKNNKSLLYLRLSLFVTGSICLTYSLGELI